jgi:integrase
MAAHALDITGGFRMKLRDLLVNRIAPLRQYCDRTIEMYGQTLDRLRDFLGHEPTLDDLDDLVASKWIRWRATTPHGLKRPVSPASVAKDSAHFRTMWTWCAKKRLKKSDGTEVEFPDYQRPRVPKPRPRAYTAEDLTKLLVYAKRRRGLVAGVPAAWYWMTKLLAMYQTGERIGAVLELRWGEVDLDRCTLTFLAHTRKGHRETITRPISARLATLMAPQKRPPDARVWPWLDDRKHLSMYASLKVLCRTAGVDYQAFHSIRKSTASYLKRAGISAREQLGHSSEEMAELHYYDEEIVGRANHLDLLPDIE